MKIVRIKYDSNLSEERVLDADCEQRLAASRMWQSMAMPSGSAAQ